jgi:hypothetical protein
MSIGPPKYTATVTELFERLPGAGELPGGVGAPVSGEAIALERGAWVRFDARIERGTIVVCSFRAWGCPHVLAAAARTAEHLRGTAVGAHEGCDARTLMQALAAPAEKLGRLLVVEEAERGLLAAARAVQSS